MIVVFCILYFVFCICIDMLWDANSGTNGAPLIGVQLMQSICCWLHEYFDCKHHLHDYYRQKKIKKKYRNTNTNLNTNTNAVVMLAAYTTDRTIVTICKYKYKYKYKYR